MIFKFAGWWCGWVTLMDILIVLGLTAWFSYRYFVLFDTQVTSENGVVENVQALYLGGASLIFFFSAARPGHLSRLVLFWAGLFSHGFFLREVDLRGLDLPAEFIRLWTGSLRYLPLVLALLWAVWATARHWHFILGVLPAYLNSRTGVWFLLGMALYVVGDGLEKWDALGDRQFYEEIAELFGGAMILLAALSSLPGLCRQPRVHPAQA